MNRTHMTTDYTCSDSTEPCDYPYLRRSAICALCDNDKDQGLLVCWMCYRRQDLQNGLKPYAVVALGEAERLARVESELLGLSLSTPIPPRARVSAKRRSVQSATATRGIWHCVMRPRHPGSAPRRDDWDPLDHGDNRGESPNY